MKKFTLIAIIATMFFPACGNHENEKKDDNNNQRIEEVTNSESAENSSFVKVLNYNKFIKNVWDFERFTDSFAYEGTLPCVIDFYATWCGPCKKVAPIMEKLAQEYNDKIIVYKVDVDAEQKLATILKIRNIPTVYFIKKGAQPSYSVGAKDETYFRAKFNNLVK